MADISLRQLRKSFGHDEVVRGIDLEIADSEFIVVLGPSGCGKSTLLRMIAGLEAITAGEVAIAGRVVNDLEPQERGCAMVFQNYALYPHMTVAENIGYALRVARVPRSERRRHVERVAASVGLTDFLDRKPGALSGGQRQRVAMARAIIRAPTVFLFDEPLSNLDARLRVQMRHEIRRIHRQVGATSIFVTHDQHEGMTMADRIVVMNAGRIEQVGTPAEIYHDPASSYVAGFVGSPAMNFLDGHLDERRGAVVVDGGAAIRVDTGAARGRDGLRVRVGLRSEAISLAAPGAPGLPTRFEFVEELGATRLYHLTHGDTGLAVMSTETRAIERGAAVTVAIPPGAVHLFDHATTRTLRARAVGGAAREIGTPLASRRAGIGDDDHAEVALGAPPGDGTL